MTIRILVPLLAVLSFSACDFGSHGASAPVAAPLVLHTYDVPKGSAQKIRGVLMNVLWIGSEGKDSNKYIGRAEVAPDGRLIVMAPESVHEGVKTLLATLPQKPEKEPGTIKLNYWVVTGLPGKSEAPLTPALEEIAPALKELEKNDGPMSFTLVEKLQVSSLSSERGKLNGRDTSARQFINSISDGLITADIELERMGQKLETRVRLEPGQLVVLASSGAPSRDNVDTGRTVYFLVRAANDGAAQ